MRLIITDPFYILYYTSIIILDRGVVIFTVFSLYISVFFPSCQKSEVKVRIKCFTCSTLSSEFCSKFTKTAHFKPLVLMETRFIGKF